jgi:hypothetical protein
MATSPMLGIRVGSGDSGDFGTNSAGQRLTRSSRTNLMLADEHHRALIHALKEIQNRLHHFADLHEGDDAESAVLLRSAIESIERVVERLALRRGNE